MKQRKTGCGSLGSLGRTDSTSEVWVSGEKKKQAGFRKEEITHHLIRRSSDPRVLLVLPRFGPRFARLGREFRLRLRRTDGHGHRQVGDMCGLSVFTVVLLMVFVRVVKGGDQTNDQ